MEIWRLCACVVLMLVLLGAEIYLSHEVLTVVSSLLDPPRR
jgi:hypothetical protein